MAGHHAPAAISPAEIATTYEEPLQLVERILDVHQPNRRRRAAWRRTTSPPLGALYAVASIHRGQVTYPQLMATGHFATQRAVGILMYKQTVQSDWENQHGVGYTLKPCDQCGSRRRSQLAAPNR